jgi:uncharacterized protein YbjQ (UPF0145 family)
LRAAADHHRRYRLADQSAGDQVIIGETPAARLSVTIHRAETMPAATTFELPGWRIVKSLGVVRGITVRTRSLPLTIIGAFRTLFGGRAGIFTSLCEKTRDESFQLMLAHARDIGGNAVVGVRYDTGPMVGAAEVLCYGTAVIVEPDGQKP